MIIESQKLIITKEGPNNPEAEKQQTRKAQPDLFIRRSVNGLRQMRIVQKNVKEKSSVKIDPVMLKQYHICSKTWDYFQN